MKTTEKITLEKPNDSVISVINGKADKAASLAEYDIADGYMDSQTDVESVYITIDEFGAVPDDESAAVQNTDAINQCIAYAIEGKQIVIIPANTYYVNGHINVADADGLKIINCGILHAVSQTRYRQLFNMINCSNVDLVLGRVTSDRNQEGTPPAGHSQPEDVPRLTSNITAVHMSGCTDTTIRDGFISNLEYVVHTTRENPEHGYNSNIQILNLNIETTSQPVLLNYVKNITISINATSCPDCSSGDHFIYSAQEVYNLKIKSCEFTYSDDNYGCAINLRNSTNNGTSTVDKVTITDMIINDCTSQFVSANSTTEIMMFNCQLSYSAEETDKGRAVILLQDNASITMNNCFVFDPLQKAQIVATVQSDISVEINGGKYVVQEISSTSISETSYKSNVLINGADITCSKYAVWFQSKSAISVDIYNSIIRSPASYLFYSSVENATISIFNSTLVCTAEDSLSHRVLYNGFRVPLLNNLTLVNCVADGFTQLYIIDESQGIDCIGDAVVKGNIEI